jgi:hypothetical protein
VPDFFYETKIPLKPFTGKGFIFLAQLNNEVAEQIIFPKILGVS